MCTELTKWPNWILRFSRRRKLHGGSKQMRSCHEDLFTKIRRLETKYSKIIKWKWSPMEYCGILWPRAKFGTEQVSQTDAIGSFGARSGSSAYSLPLTVVCVRQYSKRGSAKGRKMALSMRPARRMHSCDITFRFLNSHASPARQHTAQMRHASAPPTFFTPYRGYKAQSCEKISRCFSPDISITYKIQSAYYR